MIRHVAEFGDLPFLFKVLATPHNPDGIPDAYPFHLGVDQRTGRLVQVSSPGLEEILRQAYLHGSMVTGMMGEDGIGRDYTEDCLSLLAEHLGAPIAGARVLEIGCGNGYLLSRLAALGARTCVGIDPGPHADEARMRYGVDARRGFFPDVAPDGQFDLVIAYCLLEHVTDPVALLQQAGRFLAPGGRVAVVVQDEEPYIRTGEFSLLFHEHFSYFSTRTLRRTLIAAGGADPVVVRSRFSNLLFGCSAWRAEVTLNDELPHDDLEVATSFPERAARVIGVWTSLVELAVRQPGGAAIYVPGRAANYLATLRPAAYQGLRLIDDSPTLQGTYLPGIPLAIVSADTLISDPPSVTLIMSLSFGGRIAGRLGRILPNTSAVVELEHLLRTDGSGGANALILPSTTLSDSKREIGQF